MQSPGARARYWDGRILDWEAARYDGRWRPALGPAEWLAGWCSGPTRLRQARAVELLRPFLPGRSVVEAGCGSGRLAARFLQAGASRYLGLDHSGAAIAAAKRRPAGSRARFEVRSAPDLEPGADLVVSLGLLDWLSDGEIRAFFRGHGHAGFLHSFSERRAGPGQLLRRACRALDSLARPDAVRPRFMSVGQLRRLMPPERRGPVFVYRDPGLRDAAFLSSLPLSGAVGAP